MPGVFAYIFLVLLIGLIPLCRLIRAEHRRHKRDSSPETRTSATVVSKRVAWDNAGLPHLRDGGTVYYATFKTAVGELLELQTVRRVYGELEEGTRGEILYQNDTLLKFKAI